MNLSMLDTYQFIHKINSPLLVLLDLVVLYHVDQARVQVVHLQGVGEHKDVPKVRTCHCSHIAACQLVELSEDILWRLSDPLIPLLHGE